MFELLVTVLALGIASSFSPVILGLAIALAFGKEDSLKKCMFFFFGGLAALLVVLCAAWAFADYDEKVFKLSSTEDLLFGGVFIAIGLLSFFHGKDKAPKFKRDPNPFKWFVIGFIANITNLDAVLLEFTSAKEVFNAALAFLPMLALVCIGGAFYLSPILIPLLLSRTAGSKSWLYNLGGLMNRYGNTILGVLFLLFGAYFIWQGLN